MRQIYKTVLHMNKRIKDSLFLFDLKMPKIEKMNDLHRIQACSRAFIFFQLKNELFKNLLGSTNSNSRESITIDRPKAARHRDRKDVDINGQFSIFGQIYRALLNYKNANYRNTERIFQVNYRGEGSIDAGGPYN